MRFLEVETEKLQRPTWDPMGADVSTAVRADCTRQSTLLCMSMQPFLTRIPWLTILLSMSFLELKIISILIKKKSKISLKWSTKKNNAFPEET